MTRGIIPIILLSSLLVIPNTAAGSHKVHRDGLTICAMIIEELTEGRVDLKTGQALSLAIARAGNKHFGRVTCGDMWLYLALAHVESGFRSNVINHLNCRGIFQVHAPSWAPKFGLKYRDLLDPAINADTGIGVFKYYLHRYGGIVPALCAYNSDNPRASRGFARAVLSTRDRIRKRYAQLYRTLRDSRKKNDPVPF